MPPKKAATRPSNTSTNKKSKAKAPSVSAKEKGNNVELAPPTVPAKKPTARKAAAPVAEGAIRRSARRTTHQEGPTDLSANEVSFVQTAVSKPVTSKPDDGNDVFHQNDDVTSRNSFVPSKNSSNPSQHLRSQGFMTKEAKHSDAVKPTTVPKNSTAPKNSAAIPKTSSATAKSSFTATTNKSVVVPMSSTARKLKTTAISDRFSASSSNSTTDTSTEGQKTTEAHSEVPQQFLDEIAALKAKLSQNEAMLDKYKKSALANPIEVKDIPEPRGKYNLQEAMGLKDEKEVYNACRATVSSVMVNADIPVNTDWRRQDSVVVANIFTLAKQLEPRLAGFERNWAIAAIIRTINKNKRNYRAKLIKKYIPPKRRNGGIGEAADTGIESDKDRDDQDDGNQEPAEFSDNNDDEEGGAARDIINLDEDEAMYDSGDKMAGTGDEMDVVGTGDEMEDLDKEISDGPDSKSDDMEEEDGGIDEEECRKGRKMLKRPLFIDDDSDEKAQCKSRKSRRI